MNKVDDSFEIISQEMELKHKRKGNKMKLLFLFLLVLALLLLPSCASNPINIPIRICYAQQQGMDKCTEHYHLEGTIGMFQSRPAQEICCKD